MRIEKITLNDEQRCTFEESEWNRETESYETPKHTGIGYKMGYTIICEECFNGICEAKKVLDANKKIKSVEV